MMMNRDRLGFWVRLVVDPARLLLRRLLYPGGPWHQRQLQPVRPDRGPGPATRRADRRLPGSDRRGRAEAGGEPQDEDAIKELAALYYQSGRYDDAARVLQDGREVAPNDEEIAFTLGQVYLQEAQATPGEEQDKLYGQAGDAFAAAAEIDPRTRTLSCSRESPTTRPARSGRGHKVLQRLPRPRARGRAGAGGRRTHLGPPRRRRGDDRRRVTSRRPDPHPERRSYNVA